MQSRRTRRARAARFEADVARVTEEIAAAHGAESPGREDRTAALWRGPRSFCDQLGRERRCHRAAGERRSSQHTPLHRRAIRRRRRSTRTSRRPFRRCGRAPNCSRMPRFRSTLDSGIAIAGPATAGFLADSLDRGAARGLPVAARLDDSSAGWRRALAARISRTPSTRSRSLARSVSCATNATSGSSASSRRARLRAISPKSSRIAADGTARSDGASIPSRAGEPTAGDHRVGGVDRAGGDRGHPSGG